MIKCQNPDGTYTTYRNEVEYQMALADIIVKIKQAEKKSQDLEKQNKK